MNEQLDEKLKELSEIESNKKCHDCGGNVGNAWASLSYGIWLCIDCAGKHRNMGVHNSFVRSTTLDKWTDDQVKVMRAGGNHCASVYFREKNLDKVTIEHRYATKEAHEYSFDLYKRAGVTVPAGFLAPERCVPPKPVQIKPAVVEEEEDDTGLCGCITKLLRKLF